MSATDIIDIIEIKALVKRDRLSVITENGRVLLADNRTGERVHIGSYTPMTQPSEGCDVCRNAKGPITISWSTQDPQDSTVIPHFEQACFCPRCGRKLPANSN